MEPYLFAMNVTILILNVMRLLRDVLADRSMSWFDVLMVFICTSAICHLLAVFP